MSDSKLVSWTAYIIQGITPVNATPQEVAFMTYIFVTLPKLGFTSDHTANLWKLWGLAKTEDLPFPMLLEVDKTVYMSWVYMSWQRPDRILSLEIRETEWEWFFRDRVTDRVESGEGSSFELFPEPLRAAIALLRGES